MNDGRVKVGSIDPEEEWRMVGILLDQFNEIEWLLGQIVAAYLRPAESRGDFLGRVLMHNTVTSFGTKVKLIAHIARESGGPKINTEALHTLGRLRNAVAHTPMLHGLRVNWNALIRPTGVYLVVESPTTQLDFKERPRDDIIAEFFTVHKATEQELQSLHAHVQALP